MAIAGLVVPVPTMFDEQGAVDRARNARYARELDDARADHLFLLGSLGEFPSVEPAERAPLLDAVIETVSTHSDVWVGCGAPSTRLAVRLAQQAEEAGAAALVAVPPYYLTPTEAAIESYYREIAGAIRIPLLAYNIPAKVGYRLGAPAVHRLGRDGVLAGVKDTSGSIASVEEFLHEAPRGFHVLPGDDSLACPSLERGASGAVMGSANVVPALARELVSACRTGNPARARELQRLVDRVDHVVSLGPFPSTVKFLAERVRGAAVGYREPYGPLTAEEAGRVLQGWSEVAEAVRPFLSP